MTDLTAYESALVERVARAMTDAASEWSVRKYGYVGGDKFWVVERRSSVPINSEVAPDEIALHRFYDEGAAHEFVREKVGEAVLTALGLLGPSRTAWLAPWEATDAMEDVLIEIDDYAAGWLENLIRAGLIPAGDGIPPA